MPQILLHPDPRLRDHENVSDRSKAVALVSISSVVCRVQPQRRDVLLNPP